MPRITRRHFISSAAALGFVPWSSQAQVAVKLRCFWWGNPERDRRTRTLLEAYGEKTGVQIAAESLGWADYWTKLGTQVAGGNAPDLIQMDYRYLFEYARRGTLLPLDALLPLPEFGAGERDTGKVNGKLYGVTLGSNSKAVIYDVAMLEKVGLKSIAMDWTWDDFTRIAGEISKINPGKYWGSSDNSRYEQGFEQWLNQNKKSLYTDDGKAGFAVDDVAEWFGLWEKLRKAGVVPPAEIGAINNDKIEEFEITRQLTAMSFVNSNQLGAFQAVNKNMLALSAFPRSKGGSSGHYIKPAMLMSVSARCKAPQEAAKLVNYMVNDPAGVRTLGIERGVPASASARALLLPEADDLGKKQIDYVAAISKIAVPLPPPPPKGAGEVDRLIRRVADSVAFGKLSVQEGAKQFHGEVLGILARA
jgi:multiple sugar transport system substrate-binding protein